MATRKISMNYFYSIFKTSDGKEKLRNLTPIIKGLNEMNPEDRLIKMGDENIQLKKMVYEETSKRWLLCFLRNRIDSPFITKLSDSVDKAESLEDDEFVGHECCLIYDETTNIIALQNNRNSVSYNGITQFFIKYMKEGMYLSPIVYDEKYCSISEEDTIEYKSVIVGYTDITKLIELSSNEDKQSIKLLAKIANDLSAINGKIELSVGRTNNFLSKKNLKEFAQFFKQNKEVTNTLKVKMSDSDNIRIIDLLNNKANDTIEISVSKDDPKTFDKIIKAMDFKFDYALGETLSKCKLYTE